MVTHERWQQGKLCDCRKSLTNIHVNGPLARCETDVVNTTRHGAARHGLNIQQKRRWIEVDLVTKHVRVIMRQRAERHPYKPVTRSKPT